MFDYILGFIVLWSMYRGYRIILGKDKDYHPKGIIKGAEPFYYKKGKKKGILMIHGFSGTPADLRGIGKYLADKRITVYAPLLPGHGTSPENMATTKAKDWERKVEESYDKLRKYVDEIYVAGVSFGGNLALNLAADKKIDGIITLGTPIIFRKERMYKTIFLFLRYMKAFQKKRYPKKLSIARKGRISYDRVPLNCVKQMLGVIKKTKKKIPKIKAPILIMQSTTDAAVHEKSAHYIYKKAGSSKKEMIWIKDAYHVFLIDKNGKKYFRNIYNFVQNNK